MLHALPFSESAFSFVFHLFLAHAPRFRVYDRFFFGFEPSIDVHFLAFALRVSELIITSRVGDIFTSFDIITTSQ